MSAETIPAENRFASYSNADLAGQCRMQARDTLDVDYEAFMQAVSDRLLADAADRTSRPASDSVPAEGDAVAWRQPYGSGWLFAAKQSGLYSNIPAEPLVPATLLAAERAAREKVERERDALRISHAAVAEDANEMDKALSMAWAVIGGCHDRTLAEEIVALMRRNSDKATALQKEATAREAFEASLAQALDALRVAGEDMQYLEREALRFAAMYPANSDGRNTFVIFADKITDRVKQRAALAAQTKLVASS